MPRGPYTPRLSFRRNGLKAAILFCLAALLQGCSLMRAGYVSFRSPEDFPKVSEAPPVYAEPGAEEIARTLAAALPQAVRQIEATHGGPMAAPPPIIVCATAPCYGHYAAIPASAAETLKDIRITINGALILKGERDTVQLLTHELSHYYWYAQGILFQPRWFEEGLAVWASGGGGAEKASVEAAGQAIAAGKMIHPTLDSGLWTYLFHPPEAPDNNWYQFYRQSGMFVQSLHDSSPDRFNALLAALRQTGDLQTAWPTVYPDSPDVMWARFTADISRQATAN